MTLVATKESRDPNVPRTVDYAGVGDAHGRDRRARAGAGRGQRLGLGLAADPRRCWRPRWSGSSPSSSSSGAARFPMVEFSFFRSRTFAGHERHRVRASRSRCSPMFFFMALYMQNILGYSPLEAGIRFLPSTVVIIVAAPIAGRLTDRIGATDPDRGRASRSSPSRSTCSRASRSTRPTPTSSPPSSLMGLGIGLTMSPMSTAAMNAVDETKAGARLRDPLDEPHGRRHVRRRRGRRAVPAPERQPARAAGSATCRSARSSRRGSPTTSARATSPSHLQQLDPDDRRRRSAAC